MDTTRKMLERLYERKLSEDHDRIIIVLGDEGSGKSTLMLQCAWFHRDIVPSLDDPTVENVMGDVAWDRAGYKESLAEGNKYRPIIVHDATRIMSKKKAMHSEQVELEEDLFDSRYGRNLQLLGYQDWNHVPTLLQERRAENVFHVTSRGKFKVYGRSHMNQKVDSGRWPKPGYVDTFDALEGTDLWSAFVEEDERRKMERLAPEEEEEQMSESEVAEKILSEDGVEPYLSVHGGNGQVYVDKDLIKVEYDLSVRGARTVKKLVEKKMEEPQTARTQP